MALKIVKRGRLSQYMWGACGGSRGNGKYLVNTCALACRQKNIFLL